MGGLSKGVSGENRQSLRPEALLARRDPSVADEQTGVAGSGLALHKRFDNENLAK